MNLKDWNYSGDDAVDDRRRDISEILLNAENTFTEIPHLDVANDVMERKIRTLANGGDPYEILKSVKFPFNVPFNHAKTEINSILPYFKTTPADFYRAFNAAPEPAATAREMLGLSEEEVLVITVPASSDSALKECYGLKDSESLQAIAKAGANEPLLKLRRVAGLSAMQLNELLFQNLSDSEKAAHVSRRFFINNTGTPDQPYLTTATVKLTDSSGKEVERQELVLTDGTNILAGDIPSGYFDRIHRFLRLAAKTGLSFTDLDQVIMQLCGGAIDAGALKIIAVIKMLAETFELQTEEVCALFCTIKDYGMGETSAKTDFFNTLFNDEGGLFDIRDINPEQDMVKLQNRVQASIGCSEDEYNEITAFIGGIWTQGNIPGRLAVFYRIKKLASLLEITISSLMKFFAVLDKNLGLVSSFRFAVAVEYPDLDRTCSDIISDFSGSITEKLRLIQMTVTIVQWLTDMEISPEQLEYICFEHSKGEVDGVMTDEDRDDLFRELENQFRGVLFNAGSMQSGITERETAEKLFEIFSGITSGILTSHGLVKKRAADTDILPVYLPVIHDILFIEADDIITPSMSDEDMAVVSTVFRKMKNRDYIDPEGFITESSIDFFADSDKLSDFMPEMQGDTVSAKIVQLIFRAMSKRAVSYKKAEENAVTECSAIAEKITVASQRQKTVLLRGLESGTGFSYDVITVLVHNLFRTADETSEMAVVRFMAPVLDAIENEASGGSLIFEASLITSFRRMQQFALLVSKTELKGKELEVLFEVKKIQASLPEKIKLPPEFYGKVDSMHSDSEGNIILFSSDRYIKYSGADYSVISSGLIKDIINIPDSFHSGINAAIKEDDKEASPGKTYLFAGDKYIDTANPGDLKNTALDWGKVRNNIAETNSVDAAYRSDDGKTFIFSGDQYVRYSTPSREFVDEGYPKTTSTCFNNENQVKLPPDIREKIDTVFNTGTKLYFFSGDKFIDSEHPSEVLNSADVFGKVLNNIIRDNRVDAALVVQGKTFLFSGDQYVRYSTADYSFTDEGYPKKIAGNWSAEGVKDIPAEFENRIDSAFSGTDGNIYLFRNNSFISTENGSTVTQVKDKWGKVENNLKTLSRVDAALKAGEKTYLFTGDQYARYSSSDYTSVDEGYPKKLASNWNTIEGCSTLPDAFSSGLCAAFTAPDSKSYLFSGNSYVSSSDSTPVQVKDHWGRVRNNIQGDNAIDAAFTAPDGKTYIFRGDQFYRYSGTDYTNADEGYPKAIAGNWGQLPSSFCQKIDAAFVFNVDGADRLYLFSGEYYVRYTGTNYSQIDSGYPLRLNQNYHPEGSWFNPIYYCGPGNFEYCSIETIFTDRHNNKERVNYFYRDSYNEEKLRKFQYNGYYWEWTGATRVSNLSIAPFTSVDAGFMGSDNNVYLFSGTSYAILQGNYTGISTPAETKGKWGIVINRFQELNRVDASYSKSDGKTYLFCNDQYIRYSGAINPGSIGFHVDEGYPKNIAGNWANEDSGITVPQIFTPEGTAVLEGADTVTYVFSGTTFTTGSNTVPAAISDKWGRVVNNFETLNRVDAAGVFSGKTYLFCGSQYTRYSGVYSGYADEGYPKKIVNMPPADQIPGIMNFTSGLDGILEGTDGVFYLFRNNGMVSSDLPSELKSINSKFGIVRNNISSTGLIDAANARPDGKVYMFSGDQYIRYTTGVSDFADEGYPKKISSWYTFEGDALPAAALQGIKAMFEDADGETYIFTGSGFLALSNPSVLSPVNSKWGRVKNNIAETGIADAAFIAPDGKTYIFSGDQYTCYSQGFNTYADEGFPKKIADNWGDLPADFRTGIDAGFVFDGRTYFFKGNKYIRYSDPVCKKIDSGFPLLISSRMSMLPELRLDDIKTFQQFKKLSKKFSAADSNILPFFKNTGTESDKKELLSDITGWKSSEIDYILKADAVTVNDDAGLPSISDIQTLYEMMGMFDISGKMGAAPSTMAGEVWNKIYGANKALPAAADMLKGLLKSVTGTGSWKDLESELHGKMNIAKRDALMEYLIHRMRDENINMDDISVIDNPRDLYKYLLLDVEMGEDATTSRVQEAIMCMQLFYHRMLMNLEKNITLEDGDELSVKERLRKWWIWMKNYRVWEANRKVFLYPENYIRPELRDTKSFEFKELEEALLQSDITTEAAEKAYKSYLDKFSSLANMKVAGGYIFQRNVTDDDSTNSFESEKRIIIFGHTRTEPKKYYYMTGDIIDPDSEDEDQIIDWAPWKEIGITINADRVFPVYSFNRIFVFWIENRERDQSTYQSRVSPDDQKIQYDPVIFYSFHNHNGEWTTPQEVVNLGESVDKLDAVNKQLFIDDKDRKKNNPAAYVPVKDVLNGARLYITNPITATHYSSDEYIYISYEARYTLQGRNLEFTFEGKIKSDLKFESGSNVRKAIDLIEKNVEFPFAKFGITSVDSVSHWKGYFNDSFSAPWFSFIASGGSFLAKPYYVQDGPEQVDKNGADPEKAKLYGRTWANYPDSGFTDQYNRKHLFFRESISGPQSYAVIDGNGNMSTPVPVSGRWGKRNVFDWYPENIVCAAADGGEIYIATANRHISYSGSDYSLIDQETVAATSGEEDISKLLPSSARPGAWQAVKEDLQDFIDNLESAFVYSDTHGNNTFYLVANIIKDNGQVVREFTIPSVAGFWQEMAGIIPAGSTADTIAAWQGIDSAVFRNAEGIKKLYVRNSGNVFIKDYNAGSHEIHSVISLTHPDLINSSYDTVPDNASVTPWSDVKQNFSGYLSRLTGVGSVSGEIRLIALKSDSTYEYTVPVHEELFGLIADMINNPEISPSVDNLTVISSADLFEAAGIKRLYLRSNDTVVIFDYLQNLWSLKSVSELIHPDFISKITSLTGMLPAGSPAPWADVEEDFHEYLSTVERAIVWKGKLYLLTPKPGGGYEHVSPEDLSWFWKAAGEKLPAVAGYTSLDAAAVITEAGSKKFIATSGSNVAVFDYTTSAWNISTISQLWGLPFANISGIIQPSNGSVYIFSGRDYAEKINGVFTVFRADSKWGYLKNVISMKTEAASIAGLVDAAFMDKENRVYLIIGDYVLRYLDVDNDVIDQSFVDVKVRDFFGIDDNELKEEFSSYQGNVHISSIATNTAFTQDVNGEEKLYLFIDIAATITRYIWKVRWRWWGGWRWRHHRFFGRRRRRLWWGWWYPEYYLVTEVEQARKSAYVRASRTGDTFDTDFDYPKIITGSWTNLPGDFNKMITGTFEDKDAKGNDIFYVMRSVDANGARTYDGFVKYTGKRNFPKEICEENYEIVRMTSSTSEILSQKLFVGGIDSLLSLKAQKTNELPLFLKKDESIQDILDENNEDTDVPMTLNDIRENDIIRYRVWEEGTTRQKYLLRVPETGRLDFGSINGQYYWELFFQAPFLIAQAFNNAQNFDEAQRWFEYIFDPTEQLEDSKPFWKFIPFHDDLDEDSSSGLNDRAQYRRYLNDPFDPHAIARLRQIAYRKSIVMNYIDNIIDHGDMLFRQYTRESINEARMLYVLAWDLLGKEPELIGTRKLSVSRSFKELYNIAHMNMTVFDLENLPGNSTIPLLGAGDNVHGSILDVTGYFYIPENREFAEYWDTVIDRLTKIRLTLNIDGVKQKLALYEPPIDPMALVRAVGSGAGLAAALADFRVDVPHYRFNFIMGKSRELTGRLTQFGQSLLSALEKRDAEELSLLRNTHEKAILQLTLDIKNAQLKDAEETLKSLRVNLKSAKIREGHYNSLIANGLSPFEQSQLGLLISSQIFTNMSQMFSIASSAAGLMPEFGPFASHFGGHNLGISLSGISQGMNMISGNLSMAANMASILGSYHRRGQDWGLQKRLAQCDIESIERQIAGAEIKVKVARIEIETAKRNIKNLESVDTFMKGKFTNAQLYRWMAGKLSGLYFQTYQMALDMAKSAQRSFQFELGLKEKDISFISSYYWDSLKKGLLSGETLQVDLDRMEKAYIERNKRRFEISKSISLAEIDPLALIKLRENRVCEFTLDEALFDTDFPGHYCRQIKSVSLTFPAVIGPNSNLNATLTQLSHRTLLDPEKDGVTYLLNPEPAVSQPLSIRGDWRVNQQIALSRGVNDSGLFQLNFQDERYLPFEGTGAVSTWRLELNGLKSAFDVSTLSDVIIKVEYTSLQGGDAFGATVKKAIKTLDSGKPEVCANLFNIAQDFSAEWNAFMVNPSGGLSVAMKREMLSDIKGKAIKDIFMLYELTKEGIDTLGETAMNISQGTLTVPVKNGETVLNTGLSVTDKGAVWKFTPSQNAEEFKPENIRNIILICSYEKKHEF